MGRETGRDEAAGATPAVSGHHGQLPPITRPDGRLYRPRKLSVEAVIDWDDQVEAVVVFGTHEPESVQDMADRWAKWFVDSGVTAVFDYRVWWRDGFEGGRRMFVSDGVKGRAGCLFLVEETSSDDPAPQPHQNPEAQS